MSAIRMMVVTGGHDFDRPGFTALLDALPQVTWHEQRHPAALESLDRRGVAEVDVVLFFDFGQSMPADRRAAFTGVFDGSTGFVFLHHAIHNYPDWDEYPRILGGYWGHRAFEIDGRLYGPSTYTHTRVRIEPVADHPIGRGLAAFEVDDEVYGRFYTAPGVETFATTNHPAADPPAGWTHRYRDARVAYLQPGDSPACHAHPDYRRLLLRTIQWAAGRLPADAGGPGPAPV